MHLNGKKKKVFHFVFKKTIESIKRGPNFVVWLFWHCIGLIKWKMSLIGFEEDISVEYSCASTHTHIIKLPFPTML